MIELIPPEGATEEQIDAFLASLRDDARKQVRERMASGASPDEITDYLASLEPPSEDAVSADAVAP